MVNRKRLRSGHGSWAALSVASILLQDWQSIHGTMFVMIDREMRGEEAEARAERGRGTLAVQRVSGRGEGQECVHVQAVMVRLMCK